MGEGRGGGRQGGREAGRQGEGGREGGREGAASGDGRRNTETVDGVHLLLRGSCATYPWLSPLSPPSLTALNLLRTRVLSRPTC